MLRGGKPAGRPSRLLRQSQANNRISDNRFMMPAGAALKPVVVNSRSGKPTQACNLDKGYPFGSSADDDDGGVGNQLTNNQVVRR